MLCMDSINLEQTGSKLDLESTWFGLFGLVG